MIKKEITSIIQSRKSVYPKEFNGEIIKDKDIIQLLEKCKSCTFSQNDSTMEIQNILPKVKEKTLNEIIKVTDFSESKKQNNENRFEKTSHIISICMKKILKLFQSGKKLPQLPWRYKIFGFHAQKVILEDIGVRQNIQ